MSQFAAIGDLAQVGVPAAVTAEIPVATLNGILTKRSVYAEGYLAASGRYTLPITAWGDDLRLAVAQLSGWDVMTVVVGINPETPAGAVWQARRDEAQRWLEGVAAGRVSPVGIVDSTPDDAEEDFVVASDTPRGW